MADEGDQSEEGAVDIDAVLHLNQFGTLEHTLIKIACTPERVVLVKNFFRATEIELWPDNFNPLMAPDTPTTDESTPAVKLHVHHFTGLLVAWWKAAHYVKNKDMADYYTCIMGKVVHSPGELYGWSKLVIGVSVDGRGVAEPKKNPKVDFEYEVGHEDLAATTNRQGLTIRSFATGGSCPPEHAAKRQRSVNSQQAEGEDRERIAEQPQPNRLGVEDIQTPVDMGKQVAQNQVTPAKEAGSVAQAGQSTAMTTTPLYSKTPLGTQSSPVPQLSQYYGSSPSQPNPPPPTAPSQSGKQKRVQVSAESGRKMKSHGLTAFSRTNGIESHC